MKRVLLASVVVALFAAGEALADKEEVRTGAIFALNKSAGITMIHEQPDEKSKALAKPPNGTRLPYRKVRLGADLKPTWYFVSPPGKPAGWVKAAHTSETRPGNTAPPKRIELVDSGITSEAPTAAQTAAARGLSPSAKQYAANKQNYKLTVDQFITLEKTVDDYFDDHHDPIEGTYRDVTPEGRKQKAAQFRATVK